MEILHNKYQDYLYHGGHFLCRHIIAGQLNNIFEGQREKGEVYYISASHSHNTSTMKVLEMKRRQYTVNPFLKQLELQLLNSIKH